MLPPIVTPAVTPRTVTREDLIEFARRDLERLIELGEKLRRQKPVDREALKKCRRLRDGVRRHLRRLTRPPKVSIHLHYHVHTEGQPGVTSPA